MDRDPRASSALDMPRSGGGPTKVWGLLAMGGVAVAVGWTVWHASAPVQPCQGAARALGETWNAEHQDATALSVQTSGVTYGESTWSRVRARLDRWAERWRQAHGAICRATNSNDTNSAATEDHRRACLQHSRTAANAFLTVLQSAQGEAVRRAIVGAARLPDPTDCPDLGLSSSADRLRAAAVEVRANKLRRRLARARAEASAGNRDGAIQAALELVGEARQLGHRPLLADALRLSGEQRLHRGEGRAALAPLQESYRLAVEMEDHHRAARAATTLVLACGIELDRYDDALSWARNARAQLDALPSDNAAIEAAVLSHLASVYQRMGRGDEAVDHGLRALALRRTTFGEDDARMVGAHTAIARVLVVAGRHAQAGNHAERALRVAREALGRDHPDTAAAQANLTEVRRGADTARAR